MKRRVGVGTVALGCAVGAAAAVAIGTGRWNRAVAAAVGRLSNHEAVADASATLPPEAPPDGQASASLPDPVRRYVEFAIPAGSPRIRRARVRWRGELRVPGTDAWIPFRAVQHFTVQPPGFVWNARVRMATVLPVRVLDRYVGGRASSRARLAALWPLGGQRGGSGGTPQAAASSLTRHLAERVWLPTALLPSEGVAWSLVDERTARATLTDRGTTASVDFQFGPNGEIVGCSADRHREIDGQLVLTPWRGRFEDYVPAAGLMIPMAAQAEWLLPQGPLPVWRAELVDIGYAFGPG